MHDLYENININRTIFLKITIKSHEIKRSEYFAQIQSLLLLMEKRVMLNLEESRIWTKPWTIFLRKWMGYSYELSEAAVRQPLYGGEGIYVKLQLGF